MKKVVAVAALSALVGACAARGVRQPRMHHARELLTGALSSLESATADKGGHRVRAIEQVRLAVEEVDRGMQFDASH